VTGRAPVEPASTAASRDVPVSDVEFLLRFARTAHEAGYPTADLEERVVALADALGLTGTEVSATPTLVEIALGSLPDQRTYTLRMRPAAVDLAAIAELDDLVSAVLDGRLDGAGALARLGSAQGAQRPWPLLLAAYAVAGAALTPVLGGGWRETAAAAGVGLLVGAIALPGARLARTEPMVAPVAGVAASFVAAALVELGFSVSPNVVTLAALVTFLPGMRLTIGMRELATDHLQSGVANTASALVQLLGLVFGVGIGRSIATSWFGPTEAVVPDPSFGVVHLLAAVAAGLAFTVTLRARFRDAVAMCAATTLALGAQELGATIFGDEAAVFAAALALGLAGGLAAHRLRRSPLIFIVPGVLMLVPGSTGFTSALQLLTDQTVSGVAAAFDTFVTAMSIAYGLMVATVVLPGRFGYASTRGARG
jgi:uncharacterized membrane protein YjjP (DUF1212 family)